jgi:hypothetical protein
LVLAAGCEPGDFAAPAGRPFDLSQTRVHGAGGDRWETLFNAATPQHVGRPSTGDWNYLVGGTVNSGVAIFNAAFLGGTLAASCNDRLYVATTSNGSDNLWAFDRLYKRPPGAAADCPAPPADSRCSPSSNGWCPRRLWSASLQGTIDRSFLAFNWDGSQIYAATSAGKLYAVNANASGAVLWTFDARSEIGLPGNNAGFTASGPWVNYIDGSIYIAANYLVAGSSRIRLYRLTVGGAVISKLDLGTAAAPDGIASSVVADDAVYFGTTTGKVYRVWDNGTSLTVAAGWPVSLWSSHGGNNNAIVKVFGQPIFGSPTIDNLHNLLFVAVNNMLFAVNKATAAVSSTGIGWSNAMSATTTDVAAFSSPWADSDLMAVFLGHGQSQGNKGSRLHKRSYSAGGAFTNPTSVPTFGSSADLTAPHSSPLVLHEPNGSVWVYVGDPAGNLNRWAPDFTGRATFRTGQNVAIDSPIMIDYLSGSIYFGDNSGRVYQISQSSLM